MHTLLDATPYASISSRRARSAMTMTWSLRSAMRRRASRMDGVGSGRPSGALPPGFLEDVQEQGKVILKCLAPDAIQAELVLEAHDIYACPVELLGRVAIALWAPPGECANAPRAIPMQGQWLIDCGLADADRCIGCFELALEVSRKRGDATLTGRAGGNEGDGELTPFSLCRVHAPTCGARLLLASRTSQFGLPRLLASLA
jgi:hypothetical protein